MPVQWDYSTGIIQLSASGAITSRVQTSGNVHGIFPWLVIDPNAVGSVAGLPALHPLEDSDFLVASVLDDDTTASTLFAGRRVILLHPPNNLEGPAMAWETLDAVLLTPEALAKISPQARADLFAAGVELAVMAGQRPDTLLPWRQNGRWWIASANLHLPPSLDADAYTPTYGWNAGRNGDFRLHIFLLGAIYCLIVSGTALWRSRWMPAAITAISLCAVFIFALENRKYSPIFRHDGVVHLMDDANFNDRWIYQVSHRDVEFTIPIDGSIHPVFSDMAQPQAMNLMIDFGDHGQPISISGLLSADEPLALMSRQLQGVRQNISLVNPPVSPMRLLASDPIYRGFKLDGQFVRPGPDESWPGIVLQRR